jgi:hypothetical protein
MSLRRMFVGLCRLFVAPIVFALPVMRGRRTMRLCGVLVMLGGFRVAFLRHIRSSAIENRSPYARAIGQLRHSWWSCSVTEESCDPSIHQVCDMGAVRRTVRSTGAECITSRLESLTPLRVADGVRVYRAPVE